MSSTHFCLRGILGKSELNGRLATVRLVTVEIGLVHRCITNSAAYFNDAEVSLAEATPIVRQDGCTSLQPLQSREV